MIMIAFNIPNRKCGLLLIFTLFPFISPAQESPVRPEIRTEVRSRLVDAKTGEGIPYASIVYGDEKGVISNEEGRFRIVFGQGEQKYDSIRIESMGYEQLRLALSDSLDTLISVTPKAIDLQGVFLFSKELTVEEILENTWSRLDENYGRGYQRSRFFIRKSDLNRFTRFDIEFKKTTIPELTKPFLDSVVGILPRKSEYYREALGDWYQGAGENKLRLIKGAELYDKSNDGSLENLAEQLETIFRANVKRDSYIKVKSGIFGTKIPVDSIMDNYEEGQEMREEIREEDNDFFFKGIKEVLSSQGQSFRFSDEAELPVIEKARRYEFNLEGYEELDGQGVYVLSFEPKRKADFRGRLYIGMEDFAIMRMDFENVRRLRNIRLLGFMFRSTLYRGSIRFFKGPDDTYLLKFGEISKGSQIGVRRPLKIVEKNKNVRGRRKQNELSMKLDLIANTLEILQWVVYDVEAISRGEFEGIREEKSFKPTYMSRYDPEFWKEVSTIEPNAAIRSFQAAERP